MNGAAEYPFALSQHLTPAEAKKLTSDRLGFLFENKTVATPDGVVMLFKHEAVKTWGEQELQELREYASRPPIKKGHCAMCGAKGARRHYWYQDPYCEICFAKVEKERVEYDHLDLVLREAIQKHVDKYGNNRPLRALIGSDGNDIVEMVGQIAAKLLEEDLYGKREA